jgi:hypothetical protein
MAATLTEPAPPPATPAEVARPVPSQRGPERGRWALFAFAAVLAGVLLRVLQYAVDRSLWLDEALLASSIVSRSFAELTAPLDYGQTAPLGFLFLVRAVVEVLGSSELALRLVPLVGGIAGLLVFTMLARRVLADTQFTVALALFGLSPFLIYYSSELKQYSLDVLVSTTLLLLAFEAARREQSSAASLLPLAAVGAAGVWLSQPSIFVLASIGSVLAVRQVLARDWRSVSGLGVIGSAWLLSFGGSYAASNRGLADREYMEAFWRGGFMPFPPGSVEEWLWIPQTFARMLRDPLALVSDNPMDGLPMVVGGGAAFLVGCVVVWKRDRTWATILLLPFFLALGASAARAYPFGGQFVSGGRVLLFLLPIAFILMAEGAGALLQRVRPLGAAVVALMIIPFIGYGALSVPHVRAEVKPLLEYAQQEWQPGDMVYVYYDGRAQFDYYAARYGFPEPAAVRGVCSRLDPAGYVTDMAALAGTPRLWVLFVGDGKGAHAYDEKGLILTALDRLGRRLDDQVSIGAAVYLYDLSGADVSALNGIPIAQLPYELAFDCRGPWAHN